MAVPGVEVLAGSAEELPLPDASADAVVAASAFHWFDTERALPEIHRVLRPGGALATLGNGRDLADPLQQAIQEIVGRYLPTVGEILSWIPIVEASPLFGPPETFATTVRAAVRRRGPRRADRDGLVHRAAPRRRAGRGARADPALGEAQPGVAVRRSGTGHARVYRVCTGSCDGGLIAI